MSKVTTRKTGSKNARDQTRKPEQGIQKIFLDSKKQGHRILPILNLNNDLKLTAILYATLPDMMQAVNKHDWFVTIDLQDVQTYIPTAGELKRLCI